MNAKISEWLFKLFALIVSIYGASTSFQFFQHVFTNSSTSPTLALIMGAMGVILTDGALFAWINRFLHNCDNNHERAFAAIGAAVGLVGSLFATYMNMMLMSNEVVVSSATLQSATIGCVVIAIIHLVLITLTKYKSTSAMVQEQMSSLISEATDEMLTIAEKEFRKNIPALAQMKADELTRLLGGKFATLSEFDDNVVEGEVVVQNATKASPKDF